MTNPPRFSIERADDRVVLVPEFWPSNLDDSDRRRYDALRTLHREVDGALSIPRSDLHRLAPEPGSVVSLDDLWLARERRARRAYNGLVFPGGVDSDRDVIAGELLD